MQSNNSVMNDSIYKEMEGEMSDSQDASALCTLMLLANNTDDPRSTVHNETTLIKNTEEEAEGEQDTARVEKPPAEGKHLSYKAYKPEHIQQFIELIQEQGGSVAKHAKACSIPRSTAYDILAQWNKSGGTILPTGCLKKMSKTNGVSKANHYDLEQKHIEFLIDLVDNNPSITVKDARELMLETFPDLTISLSNLRKYMKENVRLLLTNASPQQLEKDVDRSNKLRFNVITAWKTAGIEFTTNCVFIDEAVFHSHSLKSAVWSLKDAAPKTKKTSSVGVNLSIVGCITPFGITNFSKVEPLKPSDIMAIEKEFSQSEIRKRKSMSDDTQLMERINAYHIVTFVRNVMDVLDRHNKHGLYIVMDNSRIQHTNYVVEAIESRGYKPLFLPPYSPRLNPVEECWAKIRKHIKRNPLSSSDTLTPRIKAACLTITPEDCISWIRQSELFWEICLHEEVEVQ